MGHDAIVHDLKDYQLLDSGEGRKLERIAGYVVIRPCVQAVWPVRHAELWSQAKSECQRTKDGGGHWNHKGKLKDRFFNWQNDSEHNHKIVMPIRFTNFGHCGVFFEQAVVWEWVCQALGSNPLGSQRQLKMLNLFGYTGCASLAGASMGAQVFHVDSAKGVLEWGKVAKTLSNLPSQAQVSWIHDDARSNLALGEKRGFLYDVIVLDPPAWGHGKKQDKWLFDDHVAHLVSAAGKVLAPGGTLIMTSHTPGTQHQAIATLVEAAVPDCTQVTSGDLGVQHQHDRRILPAGVYAKVVRK